MIEALLLDLLMIVFTLLALGLSRAGKSSRTERILILACAVASAYMNVSAADTASPRSVVAYAVAPVALAVVVDRVVAVIRRHVLAAEEASAWTAMGRALLAASRVAGVTALYSLRFVLAPPSTATGLRRMVLDAAPLPGLDAPEEPRAIDPPPTKKAALLALYRVHPEYGVRASAARVAAELAPQAGLQPGTARAYRVRRARGEGVMTVIILAAIALVLVARPDRALTVFSGDRIRRMRWRIRLRLHPGPGFASPAELVFRWGRLAALHHGRRARPGLKLHHRLRSRTTGYAVRLGRGQWFRRAYARLEDQVLILRRAEDRQERACVADRILDHPGPVLATSTRADLYESTAGARALRGPV